MMSGVYSLENLQEAVKGRKPARLAVLGHPVSHSASPPMHQAALDAFGIAVTYILLDVPPGGIAAAFSTLRDLGFIGCNVTVPHKLEAMEGCTMVSDQARLLGAVNTIVFSENSTSGFNTDGPGIAAAILTTFGKDLGSLKTLVLGAGGGAGRAISTQCALMACPELTLVNRSLEKLDPLVPRLRKISPGTKITALSFSSPVLMEKIRTADLIIQTTSLGLNADDPEVIPGSSLSPGQFAYDTIYQPSVTPFLKSAKSAGCLTGNGLSLLLHQGAISFGHWFPGKCALPYMSAALSGKS